MTARATLAGPAPVVAWKAVWAREPRLVAFAAVLLAAMVPVAIALGIDERELRGVNVWVKPLKFLASIALLALTTAWFIGDLPPARRRGRQGRLVSVVVWALIAGGSFELGYITLQAGLGEASHYNEADALHATMYRLMGLAAVVLVGTQPLLAWWLWRHGDRTLPRAYRHAVIVGLCFTFVLGGTAGAALSMAMPPIGADVPLFGWSLAGGDLRIAHFVGMHAEQVLPAVALTALAWRPRAAQRWLWAAAALWVLLFVAAFVHGLAPSS